MKKLTQYILFFFLWFVFIHILTSIYFYYNIAKTGQGPCMLEYVKSNKEKWYLMTRNNFKTIHIDTDPLYNYWYKIFWNVERCYFYTYQDLDLKTTYLFLNNSIYCSTVRILSNL